MSPRRKSVDSSDSSDSDSSHKDKKHKDKKDKKDKDKKKDKKDNKGDKHKSGEYGHGGSSHGPSGVPQFASGHGFNQPQFSNAPQGGFGGDHSQQAFRSGGEVHSPPPYQAGAPPQQAPPPSGFRVPLTTTAPFPDPQQVGQAPFYDADGVSPVFIGSALFEKSVHPCKIGPHLQPFASVPYAGAEYGHNGRFDLLPFRPDQMEFVHTSYGRIPPGRTPIEGGYEENGAKLYHAVGLVNGIRIPGKTGEHLGGANVPFGGAEYTLQDNYEILCWR
ncbi:hypothetical protein B0H34DRAFT_802121 [Crassisporium funariophilum]|nr:hypothetical protein B0H34DRAFT_802121 [Crassisporium funariophilum]